MKNKLAALGLSALTVLSLTLGSLAGIPLTQPFINEVRAQDDVTVKVKKSGSNLVIDASGTLDSGWWYKEVDLPITYDDGKTGTIQLILQVGNNAISAQYNWSNSQTGKISEKDDSKKTFSGEVSMPLSIFSSESFTVTYDGVKTKIGDDSSSEDDTKTSTDTSKKTDTSDQSTKTSDSTESKSKTTSLTANTDGKITVDGALDDWSSKITSQTSTDSAIDYWKVVRDTSGNVYLVFTGEASTQWYGDYDWKVLTISQNGNTENIQIHNLAETTGATVKEVNNANGNTAADYVVEAKIPASYFTDSDFTLNFAGTTIKASSIQVINGKDTTEKDDGKYHGIVIDGKFSDWNHVTKYDATCPNSAHPNCLSKAAMVFDGDYVYIYVQDGKGSTAANAGSHSNGNFAVTTDLGGTKVLHFNDDGTVTSDQIKNISSKHVGDQWEVSFPKSQLPNYSKTISFGLYSVDSSDPAEPFVKNVANLDGSGGNTGTFNGITYDGSYSDWDSYPHTVIEYATAGTQDEKADAEGAIYYHDGKVYGHVYTEMTAHLNEHGGEMAYAISIRLNKSESTIFYPRLISVDSSGNINWNPSFTKDGTYEYYIVDTNGWSSAKTLSDLNSGKYGNKVYGKMTMTIKNGKRDECEYYLDAAKLADKFNLNENDIHDVEARFGRIGQQWIGTSGASTNPWLGIAICIGVTAAVLLYRKYKKTKD